MKATQKYNQTREVSSLRGWPKASISSFNMNALYSLLFPASTLTGPLILGACGSGLVAAVGLQCVARRPNPQIRERCLKALGYGGTFGVAICVLTVMAFDGVDRPKLSAAELANTAILGFVTAGLVALIVGQIFARLAAWRMGSFDRQERETRARQPRQFREYYEPRKGLRR